jgi:FKBP-type peptidyl-prolyl cis-trans isomerase FklB
MKLSISILAVALSLVFLAGPVVAEEAYTDTKDKVGYSIGLNMGQDFAKRELEIGVDAFVQGLKDGLAGTEPKMTEEQRKEALVQLGEEMKAKQEAQVKEQTEKNKKEGAEFLAANAKKEGVKVLESGLQYKVIKEGEGEKPAAEDTVTVNYKGSVIDGTVFDSTEKRGQPATFALNQVIKGWTEALQLMKAGSKWMIFLPPELAYGPRGAGPVIGPEATLIFEVELLSITKKEK